MKGRATIVALLIATSLFGQVVVAQDDTGGSSDIGDVGSEVTNVTVTNNDNFYVSTDTYTRLNISVEDLNGLDSVDRIRIDIFRVENSSSFDAESNITEDSLNSSLREYYRVEYNASNGNVVLEPGSGSKADVVLVDGLDEGLVSDTVSLDFQPEEYAAPTEGDGATDQSDQWYVQATTIEDGVTLNSNTENDTTDIATFVKINATENSVALNETRTPGEQGEYVPSITLENQGNVQQTQSSGTNDHTNETTSDVIPTESFYLSGSDLDPDNSDVTTETQLGTTGAKVAIGSVSYNSNQRIYLYLDVPENIDPVTYTGTFEFGASV